MEGIRKDTDKLQNAWKLAWGSVEFRRKFIAGLLLLLIILAAFPFFFAVIERKQGLAMKDMVLDRLPAYDVSWLIFFTIWVVGALLIWRAVKKPEMLLHFLWSYVLLCLTRMITISLVPLDPPQQLIPLVDPMSSLYYGTGFITKDLFFSGHTATVFLMFLCLEGNKDKAFALGATILTAILLMIQHVHYSIDILAAPLFTYFIYLTANEMVKCDNRKKPGRKTDVQL
jgi:hypothetical protein